MSPQRCGGGVRVGRLRVIDPEDVADSRDDLGSVLIQAEAPQSPPNDRRFNPQRPHQGGCRENVGHEVRSAEPDRDQFVTRCQLQSGRRPLGEKRAIAEDPVDDSEIARPGCIETESDRPAAIDHLGIFDHPHGGFIAAVVDRRDPGVRVDPRLGRRVRLR